MEHFKMAVPRVGSTFDFFSAFGKPRSATSSSSSESSLTRSSSGGNHTSCLGPSGMIENLSSLHAELDTLLENDQFGTSHDLERSVLTNKQARLLVRIRKSHWLDPSTCSSCMGCNRSFGFATKKQNCRRCGKVYCESCCQYRKRLSPDGDPDPDGNIYRVCFTCADRTNQGFGAFRDLSAMFNEQRKNKRMILSDEIGRLTSGFQQNVDQHSQIKSVLSHTFSVMKVPEWQKSSKWLESSEVEWCTKCSAKFTLFNTKHHCRLCGSVFCGSCCQSNLLLYFDKDGRGVAKLIGVVGCPDKEPSVCLYVSVCVLCQDDMEEYQVQQYHIGETEKDSPQGNLKEVGEILDRLRLIDTKILKLIPKFQEKVESYSADDVNKTSIESFAKLQGDISDLFTEYAVVIQGLKKFQLSSKTELKVMKNVISLKCKNYNSSWMQYRTLKYNLDETLPADELKKKQNYANMTTINVTCLTLRQLGFEALKLANKYNFDTVLAEKLSTVDQVCFVDLKNFVENSNEDWEKHLDVFNMLLKEQYQKKPLVLPSLKLTEKDGKKYVRHYLIERSYTILSQIVRALNHKSSENKFVNSKEALENLTKLVGETVKQQSTYR